MQAPAPLGSAERSEQLQARGFSPDPPEHIRREQEQKPWTNAPVVVYQPGRGITSAARGVNPNGFKTLPRPAEAWECVEQHWRRIN